MGWTEGRRGWNQKGQLGEYSSNSVLENTKDVGQASDSATKTKPKSRNTGEKEPIVHGEEEPDTKMIPTSDKEEQSLLA